MIYSNLDDQFMILDYHPSHSQLVIRSIKNKYRNFNIDIIFKAVKFISLPTKFKGLEIKLCTSKQREEILNSNFRVKLSNEYKLFQLKDLEDSEFYIPALAFGVFHNKLSILETSIDPFNFDKLGEKIFWYSE